MSDTEEWFWDLDRKQAVRSRDRGPGDNTMGPYPTKGAAENWKAITEQRNQTWDNADEAWNDWPDKKPDTPHKSEAQDT